MNNRISGEIVLLQLLSRNQDTSVMIGLGFSYSQVYMLLKRLKSEGFVEYGERAHLKLTELGKQYLKYYTEKSRDQKKFWVLPQKKYYRTPIDIYNIIVPKKK